MEDDVVIDLTDSRELPNENALVQGICNALATNKVVARRVYFWLNSNKSTFLDTEIQS